MVVLRCVYAGDFVTATWCNFCHAKVATSKSHAWTRCDLLPQYSGVSNMFETWYNFAATKVVSSCHNKNRLCKQTFNPLTPVPPVTTHDEPWPFFLFWRHHFQPKLASSILNFCRRERSFQWCPDQSDRLNGVLDMHKNAQKVEWKTQSKISCHYTWLLHATICPSRWRFLRSFLTASKPSRKSITVAKRREKEKKKRRKKKSKMEKP